MEILVTSTFALLSRTQVPTYDGPTPDRKPALDPQ